MTDDIMYCLGINEIDVNDLNDWFIKYFDKHKYDLFDKKQALVMSNRYTILVEMDENFIPHFHYIGTI